MHFLITKNFTLAVKACLGSSYLGSSSGPYLTIFQRSWTIWPRPNRDGRGWEHDFFFLPGALLKKKKIILLMQLRALLILKR